MAMTIQRRCFLFYSWIPFDSLTCKIDFIPTFWEHDKELKCIQGVRGLPEEKGGKGNGQKCEGSEGAEILPLSLRQAVSHPQKPLAGAEAQCQHWQGLCGVASVEHLPSVPHAWDDWVSIGANFVGFHNAEDASRYTWQFPPMREEQVRFLSKGGGAGEEALGASKKHHIHIFISRLLWSDSGQFLL